MNLNIGIVGFGRIGAEHETWLRRASGIRATAVFDPTPARREMAASRGYATVDQLQMLLADQSIDAVLISTPTAMHFDHAMLALKAGKHVMVEKPVTLELSQAKQLADHARSAKKVLSVFHCRRWDVDYLTARDAMKNGTFGKIINIESRISQWASCVGPATKDWRPGWRNEAAFGGGGLYDWGSHLIDQLWRMMLPAKPVSLFAQLRGNVWTNDCDDFARVILNFDNGAVGLMEINTTTRGTLPRWHIDGTLGSAEGPISPTYDTREWGKLRFTGADGTSRIIPLSSGGLSESDIWSQFAKATCGEGKPAVTIESVLPTMALLDAARQSSREGASVDLSYLSDWPE